MNASRFQTELYDRIEDEDEDDRKRRMSDPAQSRQAAEVRRFPFLAIVPIIVLVLALDFLKADEFLLKSSRAGPFGAPGS